MRYLTLTINLKVISRSLLDRQYIIFYKSSTHTMHFKRLVMVIFWIKVGIAAILAAILKIVDHSLPGWLLIWIHI